MEHVQKIGRGVMVGSVAWTEATSGIVVCVIMLFLILMELIVLYQILLFCEYYTYIS